MADGRHTVLIDRELAELIPAFLENRRNDVRALRAALVSDDFEGLRLTGDRIRGVAASYGFARLAAIARLIEDNAKLANRAALHTLVEEYARHVAGVEVAFTDGPTGAAP